MKEFPRNFVYKVEYKHPVKKIIIFFNNYNILRNLYKLSLSTLAIHSFFFSHRGEFNLSEDYKFHCIRIFLRTPFSLSEWKYQLLCYRGLHVEPYVPRSLEISQRSPACIITVNRYPPARAFLLFAYRALSHERSGPRGGENHYA